MINRISTQNFPYLEDININFWADQRSNTLRDNKKFKFLTKMITGQGASSGIVQLFRVISLFHNSLNKPFYKMISSKDKVARIELEFTTDKDFTYIIEFNKEGIHEEQLISGGELIYFSSSTKDNIGVPKEIKEYLSSISSIDLLSTDSITTLFNVSKAMMKQDGYREDVLYIMQNFGFPIKNFVLTSSDDVMAMYDRRAATHVEKEADDFKMIFSLLAIILPALKDGRVVFLDNADLGIPIKHIQCIVGLFNDTTVNELGAQLIFTSNKQELIDKCGLVNTQVETIDDLPF